MTEGRGRVFSRGLSLRLREGFGGLFAGVGQALRLIYLLDLPGEGSWSREPRHWGGGSKQVPEASPAAAPAHAPALQRVPERCWGQGVEEEVARTRHRPALRPVRIPPLSTGAEGANIHQER